MIVTLEITRRKSSDSKPYLQSVKIDTGTRATVALLLERINTEQLADDPIQWECSCKQKKCGACAMLINGRPRLACDAVVSDYPKGRIRLGPLRKFPVVRDLIVDRSVMFANLEKLGAWLDSDAADAGGDSVYEASRCLQCGCCLEVCPNFYADGGFFGAAVLAPASRLIEEAHDDMKKRLYGSYNEHFYRGCGKSFACRNICPAGIDTEHLLVRSNSAAVWKRRLRHGK